MCGTAMGSARIAGRRRARSHVGCYAISILLFALTSTAQDVAEPESQQAENSKIPIEVFKGPKPKDLKVPPYPEGERRMDREGWVNLNFMIDPQGNPYQIVVTDSTGNETFEKLALKAVEKWTFEPASLDGKPIHSGQNFKVVFTLKDRKNGANAAFVNAYKNLGKAIEANDRTLADRELARLKVQNLYEDAYYGLAYFRYYNKWGTESQQLEALTRAVARENKATYLPKDLFTSALFSLFSLQVRANDFASAASTWYKLKNNGASATDLAKLNTAIAEMKKLQQDDRSYRVPAEISKGTSWNYVLFKNKFQIQVMNGRVDELKLRCDKRYVFFAFDPSMQYKVEPKYGTCALEVVGDEGTKFQLIQY